jgi:hypothetical protein
MIPYKPYIRRKHVESILWTPKNMTKKVFNLNNTIPHSVHLVNPISFFLQQLLNFCVSLLYHIPMTDLLIYWIVHWTYNASASCLYPNLFLPEADSKDPVVPVCHCLTPAIGLLSNCAT